MRSGELARARKRGMILMAGRKNLGEPVRRQRKAAAVFEPAEHVLQKVEIEPVHVTLTEVRSPWESMPPVCWEGHHEYIRADPVRGQPKRAQGYPPAARKDYARDL